MKTIPLTEIPLIKPGDDLSEYILESLKNQELALKNKDILVIAQSVVSKAEGNIVDLSSIEPSSRAKEIGKKIDEDPRRVKVILDQTQEITRLGHVLITLTNHGFVCADAGVDDSNVEEGKVTILPENPDNNAEEIRKKIKKRTGKEIAVIISDSWGRPFRLGAVGFAIGIAGITPLKHLKGEEDAYGGQLETTKIAPVDALAAAASLEMGESHEKVPAVLIRNAPYESGEGSISELFRSEEMDLFR
ncbi:coenzyme F420:L-glutamate ligase [candidate division MSBL1 archaeon SCGC-AAA382F02]|uniref:Coenzyme F420:L-glutamate ligase n=1 Tax=candidate division MSBL1 archaeon SCGC-AAA382F02 TaxID=1698282 RepID=A0A133VHY6_9EURY|nr:coenzyme F420:L-glutamate ligase [candidate division MSBL1 archaeon SCGC-AAA382F02]